MPPEDLGPPDPNAFAVVGNDVSIVVFDDPAQWLVVMARGSGADVGLPAATARIRALGLLAAQASHVRTRFDGPGFDAIVGVPSSFNLISGRIDARFDGMVLRELGLSLPPSLNAWGLRNSGTATITLKQAVPGITLVLRGSDLDVGLNRADAVITARGPENQFVLPPTAVRTDLGFYLIEIPGPVQSIELTNSQAGSVAVFGEITIAATADP